MRRLETKRAYLGDLFVERGLITAEQREAALAIHRQTGRRLGEVLVEMELVNEADVIAILAERAGLPFARLRKGLFDQHIASMIPRERAERDEVLPLFRIHNRLVLAIGDPHEVILLDTVRKLTGCDVQPVVCPPEDIRAMIPEAYAEDEVRIEDLASGLDEADVELVSQEPAAGFEDISAMAGRSPIINLVNQIVLKAIKERASDIHIEPERKYLRIRFRIDGVLYEVMRQRIDLHAPIISRLKIMANLDIAERRLPQDGRIQVLAQGRTVDLRFSSLPGIFGEKVVLRVLDKETGLLGLDELGLASKTLASFRALLSRPHGLVLVTGPTGSGKTTTLYAGLKELNSVEKNIVTIEDPVEYQFEIVNQNQVRDEIGLSFARILRHVLRQDPDIVMVGEIRDAETAEIAVQAALTGHMVLSTMHTNDATSSVSRLLEMGVEAYLLASALIGVIGQRLVRTICSNCATEYYPSPAELQSLEIADKKDQRLRRGRGCDACFDSGYHGRIGIYELLLVDADLRRLLLDRPTIDSLRRHQDERDLPSLRSEGLRLVLEGVTTLEEVSRAAHVE
ncbi:MAG: Flp pilus assembly complex ATPase component TadA [Candidatus Eisenbacteria sp.]|nr:Flp pilus assembly complex ATPase component TadA [Candidatus Eisenbacteria bacterium]